MNGSTHALMDVVLQIFGQRDDAARSAAIGEVFTDDVKLADAEGVSIGRAGVDAKVRGLLAGTPPEFVFAPDGPVHEIDDLGVRSWVLGPAGAPPVVRGTDVVTVRDGRISALYTFLADPGQ